MRLFIDRALPKRPDLTLDDEAIATIGAICRAVDGLPLGIEFAAASLRYQSLEGLATTLASGDDARASSVFGPSSQSNVLEWTFETLSESEASVLCKLSTFIGGFSLDAAEAVCDGAKGNTVNVPLCVASLVDKSLIEYESGSSGDWYRLLEVTRRFAEKRLLQSGVAEAVNAAHLRWYDEQSRQAESNLRAGGQVPWLAAIDREYDNLRIAIERAGWLDPPVGVEIASRLCLFWLVRGRIGEGVAIVDRALEAADASDLVPGRGHLAVGILSAFSGDGERALVSGRRAWAAGASLADRQLQGTATWLLGLAEMILGRVTTGTKRVADAATIAREIGDHWLFAHAQTSLGNAYFLAGDVASARLCYGEALAIREQHQDFIWIAWTAFRLGVLQSAQGEFAASSELLNQALQAAGTIEYTQGILLAKLGIADASYLQGDVTIATEAYLDARGLARIVEDEASESFALGGLTQLAAEGQHENEAAGWMTAQAETGSRMSLQARASLLRSRSVVAELHRYEAEAAARRRGALLLYHHIGDIRAAIEQLEEVARHAGQFEDLPTAAALLAVAETLRGRTGLRVAPRTTDRLAPVRRHIDESHDPKVREAAITGQTMSLTAAIALALRVRTRLTAFAPAATHLPLGHIVLTAGRASRIQPGIAARCDSQRGFSSGPTEASRCNARGVPHEPFPVYTWQSWGARVPSLQSAAQNEESDCRRRAVREGDYPIKESLSALARRLQTTPGQMRFASATTALMTIVVSIAAIAVLHTRHDATQSIASVAQPSLVHASNAYASFSDADATASIAFLTGDLDLVNGQSRYISDLRIATDDLAAISRTAGATAAVESSIFTINSRLPAYTGLVESARSNNLQGFPVGSAYLRRASETMRI